MTTQVSDAAVAAAPASPGGASASVSPLAQAPTQTGPSPAQEKRLPAGPLSVFLSSVGIVGLLAAAGFGVASSYNDLLGVDALHPTNAADAVIIGGTFVVGTLKDLLACFAASPLLSLVVIVALAAAPFVVEFVLTWGHASRDKGALTRVFIVRMSLLTTVSLACLAKLYFGDLPSLEVSNLLTKHIVTRFDVAGSPAFDQRAVNAYERAICARVGRIDTKTYPEADFVGCLHRADSLRQTDTASRREAVAGLRTGYVLSVVFAMALLGAAVMGWSTNREYAPDRIGQVVADRGAGVLALSIALLTVLVVPLHYAKTRLPTLYPAGTLVYRVGSQLDSVRGIVISNANGTAFVRDSTRFIAVPSTQILSFQMDSLGDPVTVAFLRALTKEHR